MLLVLGNTDTSENRHDFLNFFGDFNLSFYVGDNLGVVAFSYGHLSGGVLFLESHDGCLEDSVGVDEAEEIF